MRSPQPTSAMEPTLTKALKPTISLRDRKSTRLNSSHPSNSYAVFRLKKKTAGRSVRRDPGAPPTTALRDLDEHRHRASDRRRRGTAPSPHRGPNGRPPAARSHAAER